MGRKQGKKFKSKAPKSSLDTNAVQTMLKKIGNDPNMMSSIMQLASKLGDGDTFDPKSLTENPEIMSSLLQTASELSGSMGLSDKVARDVRNTDLSKMLKDCPGDVLHDAMNIVESNLAADVESSQACAEGCSPKNGGSGGSGGSDGSNVSKLSDIAIDLGHDTSTSKANADAHVPQQRRDRPRFTTTR